MDDYDVRDRHCEDALAEYRHRHVPLYGDQPLKLGLFAVNCNNSAIYSVRETGFDVTWDHSLEIAQLADRIGLEVLVPVARWLGFGGRMDLHTRSFETRTYAAARAASTTRIMPFATVHATVVNPVMVAKTITTTIDHRTRPGGAQHRHGLVRRGDGDARRSAPRTRRPLPGTARSGRR
ncbi:hypothetical protein ACWD7C_17850 [Streptomyces sp. NPDC005134]|uniref:hypothetical protein n=1 Tax=Streptomyces sp. NPDC005098 TaxID=3154560 RepID=UPI0033B73592